MEQGCKVVAAQVEVAQVEDKLVWLDEIASHSVIGGSESLEKSETSLACEAWETFQGDAES